MTPRIAVVGGGITGLTTAFTLQRAFGAVAEVLVFEASDRIGGKLVTNELGGHRIDEGADAFLLREPHMTELCEELGLADEIVHPATGRAYIWYQGAQRAIPPQQVLGVPFDLDALAESGLITEAGLARARHDLDLPDNAPAGDESVGSLVRRRLGDEVLENLTDALLGGINAGSADAMSLQAGVPRLAAALAHDPSAIRSLRAHLAEHPPTPGAPVFGAHPEGMGAIVDALVAQLDGRIHTGHPVTRISRGRTGYRLHGTEPRVADAVVVAVPAFAADAMLADLVPDVSPLLESIGYASVAVVTLVYGPGDAPAFDGSGFLVPHGEGLLMTACSWASTKWAHHGADGRTVLRVSAGRFGDDRADQLSDDDLVAQLRKELTWTADIAAEPEAVRVTRWPLALPQYRPGHLDLVGDIDAVLARETPGLFVAGAAYRGLGLPACVHQGRVAAQRVERHLSLANLATPAPGEASGAAAGSNGSRPWVTAADALAEDEAAEADDEEHP